MYGNHLSKITQVISFPVISTVVMMLRLNFQVEVNVERIVEHSVSAVARGDSPSQFKSPSVRIA